MAEEVYHSSNNTLTMRLTRYTKTSRHIYHLTIFASAFNMS